MTDDHNHDGNEKLTRWWEGENIKEKEFNQKVENRKTGENKKVEEEKMNKISRLPLATSSMIEVFCNSHTEGWITPSCFSACFIPPPPAIISIPAKNSSAHTSMAVSSASGVGASQWSVRLYVSLRASNMAKNLAAVPWRSVMRRSVGVRGHACWRRKEQRFVCLITG